MSSDVEAVHVHAEDSPPHLVDRWKNLVEAPALSAGTLPPKLKIIKSPYRHILNPILEHVTTEAKNHPDRHVVVIIPERVLNRWYHYFLHNKRGALLKTMLYFAGNPQIVVMNVPWYLGADQAIGNRQQATGNGKSKPETTHGTPGQAKGTKEHEGRP